MFCSTPSDSYSLSFVLFWECGSRLRVLDDGTASARSPRYSERSLVYNRRSGTGSPRFRIPAAARCVDIVYTVQPERPFSYYLAIQYSVDFAESVRKLVILKIHRCSYAYSASTDNNEDFANIVMFYHVYDEQLYVD